MNNEPEHKAAFKYNMSFYYQSTIVYFAVFIIYIIVRGEFVEDSFTLITKDPIIYFFGIIVLISIISLLYNIYKSRHVEVTDSGIIFKSRNKERTFLISEISEIKIARRRKRKGIFSLIRIRIKNKRRPIIIRPYDYENDDQLIKKIHDLKMKLESKNV